MSRKQKYSFTTTECKEELKKIKLKKNSESKIKWAVNAYTDWCNQRLLTYNFDVGIYEANLEELPSLTKENFQHALCHFIPEVTKVKGEGPYPGKTLYQMVVALQKYLQINKMFWKLVDGQEFYDLHNVLDNVMQERTAMNIGVVKKQAAIISYEMENFLWEHGFLGEDEPDKLYNTVLFLLGINVFLRAIEEHYNLRREMENEASQLSFENDSKGVPCLVYREDTVSITHDGGLNDMRRERKIVWVYPSTDINRYPVRLTKKYLSLCPKSYTKKKFFYLKSLDCKTPKQWYGQQVVGTQTLSKVVKELMQIAEIEGFFTNHSLRRTGGTCLFQAGVSRKLIKEATSHRSDAVDAYQVTSDEQRKGLSEILSKGQTVVVENNSANSVVITEKNVDREEVTPISLLLKKRNFLNVRVTVSVKLLMVQT